MATGRVQITFDCADPDALATFWAAALEYLAPDLAGRDEHLRSIGIAESDLRNWCRIEDPEKKRPRLFFQRVPEGKTVKNRVHLDIGVTAGGPGDQEAIDAEVERLVGHGATILRPVADEAGYFVIMQDPEGNEFCVD
jgi:hypothetical protein